MSDQSKKWQEIASQGIAIERTLRIRIGALEAALRECIDTLQLVECPNSIDPQYGEEVRRLGDRIGYGAMMSSASASWRKKLAEDGYPVGGEFVAGPCHGSVLIALKKARAALAPEQDK